jgi:hypothetical protein
VKACFFCAQNEQARILYQSEHFYVLLGLGPIVEGYVILAARQHIRSMFDLPEDIRVSYINEKQRLKQLINETYGPSIVTEHGRIQACVIEDEEAHDLLCYHAHQLFFPIDLDLSTLSQEGPFEKVFEGASLFAMSSSDLLDDDEYLFFENSAGRVFIYKVRGKCPRQYMRYLVARSIGKPELASWQKYPAYDTIWQAKDRYNSVLSAEIKAQGTGPVPIAVS